MQPGFITGAGSTSHALLSGLTQVTPAIAIVSANAAVATADRPAPEAQHDRVPLKPRRPVIRGIAFALSLSAVFWVGILYLSFG